MMGWASGSHHRAHRAEAEARPDLVDLIQVQQRLGMRSDQLRRWARDGSLPPPHYRFATAAVWHWPDLVASLPSRSAGTNGASGPVRGRPTSVPRVDLVSFRQIAGRLRMPESELRTLIRSRRFPRPDYRFSKGDAWLWKTVQRWNDEDRPRLVTRSAIDRVESEHLEAWHHLRRATGLLPEPNAQSHQELLARFEAISQRLGQMASDLRGPVSVFDPRDPQWREREIPAYRPGVAKPGTIVSEG